MWRACGVVVTLSGLLSAAAATAAEADTAGSEPLYLGVREPNLKKTPQSVGLLVREIPRQAFLIAARDECGLPTRDSTLREEFPPLPDDKSPMFELQTFGKPGERLEVSVYIKRKNDPARRVIWETHLALPRHGALVPLVEKTEALSRGDFKDLLKKEGFSKSVPAPRAHGAVPADVYTLLSHWSEIDTLRALWEVHREIHKQGDAPELLAALAIGYANLGVLADRQWSPAYKAYQARALLYAQRLVGKTDASLWALAHRAYVRTLVGLHAAALADIEKVRGDKTKAAAGKPIPEWLNALDLFCQGETVKLLDAAKTEPARSVALVLRMLEADPTSATEQMVQTSLALLQAHRTCHRAAEGICAAEILGISHSAVPQSLAVFRRCLEQDLNRFPGIPESVRRNLAQAKPLRDPEEIIAHWVSVMDDLKEAGRSDRSEPSLSVLASLVQEMGYLVAYRKMHHGRMLGVPTVDTLAQFLPLVKEHPDACILETMSTNHAEFVAGANKLRDVDYRNLDFTLGRAVATVIRNSKRESDVVSAVVASHADETFRDLVMLRTRGGMHLSTDDKKNEDAAAALRAASPHMPVVIGILVDIDWKTMEKEAPRLEKDYIKAGFVLTALSIKYMKLKRWDDAERCLRTKIGVFPSYGSYVTLATVYKEKGDMDRWRETLEKSLDLPSLALESAHVRLDLAEYYVKRKEYQSALAYADRAAQCNAAWALLEAARCHELAEEWSTAEKLVRVEAERYVPDAFRYMLWCARTGHGDTQTAQDIAQKYFESLGTPAPPNRLNDIAAFYLLQDDPQKSLIVYREAFRQQHVPYEAMHAALLCDRLGDASGRDSLLKAIAEMDPNKVAPSQKPYLGLTRLFRDALAAGNAKSLDPGQVDAFVKLLKEGDPTDVWYFVGMFFDIHGEKDKSRDYLLRSATSPIHRHNHVFARVALRKQHVKTGPERDAEMEKP